MITARRNIVAALVALGCVSSALLIQDDVPLIKVRHVLDEPDMPAVKLAGVCHITAESIRCWDAEGKNFQSLSDKIWAHYHSQGNSNLTVKIGMKNRWIALERPENSQTPWIWNGFEWPLTEKASSTNIWRPGTYLEWVHVPYFMEDKEGQVRARFYRSVPPVRLMFAGKESAIVDGDILRFRSMGRAPKPAPDARPSSAYDQPYQILLDRKGGDDSNFVANPNLLGLDGKVISYMDSRGAPYDIQERKYVQGLKSVQIWLRSGSESDLTYVTNVNPKYIAGMSFRVTLGRQVEFTGIPLDPKP